MTYFGGYHEPENLCYHAASTECLRITMAYIFARGDTIWQDIIEELEDPC